VHVKIQSSETVADTYSCEHCEVTERGPNHREVREGKAAIGFEIQLVGIRSVERERVTGEGKTRYESEAVTDDTFGDEGVKATVPGTAAVVYLMNDRRVTTKVLRPKPEWTR
jgi:hypothetical protein